MLRPSPSRSASRRLASVGLAVLLAVGGAACSSDDGSPASSGTTAPDGQAATTTTVAAPVTPPVEAVGTYAVGSREEVLVDDSRVTQAHGGVDEQPERTLPTLVLYPAEGTYEATEAVADAPPVPGPWPLVVFSHGLGGTGPAYGDTLRTWASAGYVVLAPTYPLANTETPGGPSATDIPEQTADVAFLVDWARAEATGDGALAGVVDPERVGLAGHSLGSFTSLAVGYNPCCRDERVGAVAGWAGGYVPQLGDGGPPVADGPPLLLVHGDADGTVPYARATDVLDAVEGPRALVTLVGGPHTPPFVQGLNDPAAAVVTETTLAFFDQHLKGDESGAERLRAVVEEAGPDLATLEERP